MNKTNSKWFANRKVLVLSILLIFAGSIFSAFAFNLKQNNVEAVVSQVETTEQNNSHVTEVESPFVSFAYSKDGASSSVQSMAASVGTANTHTDPFIYSAYWSWSQEPVSTLNGGTTIAFTNTITSNKNTISFTGSTETTATLTINPGWQLTGYTIYVGGDEVATYSIKDNKILSTVVSNAGNSNDITTEELVPNYNTEPSKNTIKIEANLTAIKYSLNLYYSSTSTDANGKTNTTYLTNDNLKIKDINANSSTKIEVDETITGALNDNGALWNKWVLVPSDKGTDGFTIGFKSGTNEDSISGTIVVTPQSNNKNGTFGKWEFTFSGKEENNDPTNAPEASYIYHITGVKGYGNLIQNGEKPFLRAKWSIRYDLTIDNSNESDMWNGGDYASANQNNELAGVALTTTSTSYDDTATVHIHATQFAPTVTAKAGMAFTKRGNAAESSTSNGRKFGVFNYGHEIENWKLTGNVFILNNKTLQSVSNTFYLDGKGEWTSSSGNGSTLATSNLTEKNFKALAEYIDSQNYALTPYGGYILDLRLQPNWKEATIQLKDAEKSNSNLINTTITYGGNYNLSGDLKFATGQSLFAFASKNGNLVALGDGTTPWNYKDIADYEYVSNGTYNLSLSPIYLANIYKIKLEVPIYDNQTLKDIYDMRLNSYYKNDAFTGFDGEYTEGSFDTYYLKYNSKVGGSYYFGYEAFTNQTFIEDYTAILVSFKNSYNPASSEDFKYVYMKDNNIYTHLVHGAEIDLPSFYRDYYEQISWDDNFAVKTAYKTALYRYDDHKDEYNIGYTGQPQTKWELETKNNQTNTTLTAHFFRRYYELDIKTILGSDENTIGRYGYVHVQIHDAVNSTKEDDFYAYYEDDKMIYVKVGNDGKFKTSDDALYDYDTSLEGTQRPRLYAGCGITITLMDQNSDMDGSVKAGSLDHEILGYKAGSYYAKKDGDEITINSYDGNHKDLLVIFANFNLIKYIFNIKIDDEAAGPFKTSYEIGNFTQKPIEIYRTSDTTKIYYSAKFGYTFEANAIKLGSNITLSEWDGTKLSPQDGSEVSTEQDYYYQDYNLKLTGDWLFVFYYDLNNNYSTDDVTMPDITICTQKLNFTLDFVDANGVLGKVGSVTKEYGLTITDYILTYADTSYNGMRCRMNGEDYYTIVGSWAVAEIAGKNEHVKTYNFPFEVSSVTDRNFILNEANLKALVDSTYSGSGKILTDTTATIKIDFREIEEIHVTVVDAYKDLLNNYSAVFQCSQSKLTINESVSSGTFYVYAGAKYSITTSLTESNFSAVEYKESEVANFAIAKHDATYKKTENLNLPSTMAIYIQPLVGPVPPPPGGESVITYWLGKWKNGVLVYEKKTLTQLKDLGYIATAVVPNKDQYVLGNTLNYEYSLGLQNCDLLFEVNDAYLEDNDSSNAYKFALTISQEHYTKLGIDVYVIEANNQVITVNYILASGESNKATFEDLGTVDVYIGYNLATADESGNYTVVEGQTVIFDIKDLNAGYYYDGRIMHKGTSKRLDLVDGTELLITDSFIPDTHGGSYQIIVRRLSYVANLDLSCSGENEALAKKNYNMQTNVAYLNWPTSTTATKKGLQVQVGHKLTFTGNGTIPGEDIEYYYYIAKDGSTKVPIVDDEGNYVNYLEITSDLINQSSENAAQITPQITIGYIISKNHKLDINIISGENLIDKENTVYTEKDSEGKIYISGTYLDSGSIVNVKIAILLSDNYNLEVVASNGDYSYIGSGYDKDITLTENIVLTVKVTPKQYTITTTSYLYERLTQVFSTAEKPMGSPTELTPVDTMGRLFGQSTTLKFAINSDGADRVLTAIKFKVGTNDAEDIEISDIAKSYDINGCTVNVTSVTEGSTTYIQLTFTCSNNIEIGLYYTAKVEIKQS